MIVNWYRNLFSKVISLIDYNNKKKIYVFFKNKIKNRLITVVDIGAHRGETIDFFLENFKIKKILAFEPNLSLFKYLNNKKKKFDKKVILLNFGVGLKKSTKILNIMADSSSSTINAINRKSDYYKRKMKFLSIFFFSKKLLTKKQKISVNNLSYFIKKNNFKNIDILKIDAEGYEYNILKGINNLDFKKIRFIYFEHHYDLMIKKGYKFSQINEFLNKKNFFKKYKLRMKFRKSFEYIYELSKKKNSR